MLSVQSPGAKNGQAPEPARILQVDNLTMTFKGVKAVNDLSFDVHQGEIFGIAGPNGAGKTTVFNVISGLHVGTGRLRFQGEDIAGLKPHHICRRGIARTLQIPQIFASLAVEDNVRFGAHFGNAGPTDEPEVIRTALDFVGLTPRRRELPPHMDLYHKKLIMLAAALATQPKLLLLDEPIGGLSLAEIGPLIALIQKINRQLGITIIIIEHLMKVLKALSDRLMIIHYGERICLGRPDAVMQDRQVREVYLG